MHLKKLLMIGVCGVGLGIRPAYAFSNCAFSSWVCFFQDVVSAGLASVNRLAMQHTTDITYDVKQGLEQIKENIGMYQDQGKCGISVGGVSGCSPVTEEQAAEIRAAAEEADAAAAEAASVVPDSTISLVQKSEGGGDFKSDGKTFDAVREGVALFMFVTDDSGTNADCQCSAGTGSQCSVEECAQQRQNEALVKSSTGASAMADTYLKDISENYSNLDGLVEEINSAGTIADFVGKLGLVSVYASSAVVEQMTIQAYDLRAQSYRGLVSSGIQRVDLGGGTK